MALYLINPPQSRILEELVFYFFRGVDYLHFLRDTEACLSFVFAFPAPFRPLSAEATVGTGTQRQYHYAN